MKKLTAMLLALCMLLAVVPALGEDFSGTWYMTLADVTLGRFQLNEDGTGTLSMPSQEDVTGTWTAGENTLTFTAEGEPVSFVYDGTSLTSDKIPLALTREEGKLPMDVIVKMVNGEEYELPEGMTETDLMAVAMGFLAEYTKLMEQFGTDENTGTGEGETPAEPAAEPAAEEAPAEGLSVTILQGTFKVIESYNGFRGTYIAKVQNNNANPVWLTGGTLLVKDAEGNQVGQAERLYTCGSKYLEPGEISFISMQADLEADGDYSYEATVESEIKSYYSTDKTVTATDPVYVAPQDYDSGYMKVTVINDTDAPLPYIEAVFVLEDADGNLLQLSTEGLYRYELGVNSTITLVTSVDSRLQDFCKANGIEPAAVEAFAWVENRD